MHLDFPTVDSTESVVVEDFLSIKHAEINLGRVTALLGPQASGKSVIAKIFFFCREYIDNLYSLSAELGHSKPDHDAMMRDDFHELFSIPQNNEKPFNIHYIHGAIELNITTEGSGRQIKFRLTKQHTDLYNRLKRDFLKIKDEIEESSERRRIPDFSTFWQMRYDGQLPFMTLPDTLLVPASRSFFSTIQREVFTLLTAQKSLDPIQAQFGRFFEMHKNRFSRISNSKYINSKFLDDKRSELQFLLREILSARYFRKDSKDFIENDWGIVELSKASSGQQEGIPLLFSITHFPIRPAADQLLIVEEPEAHLFPIAQKAIVDLIVSRAKQASCRILLTTHSPYIISCLNNHFLRSESKRNSVSAYFISDGHTKELFDEETGMLDYQDLDKASDMLVDELYEILDA